MSGDKLQRLTDSPRKVTHLQVTRQASRGREDSFDNDDTHCEYNFSERRGSSQSISRYNSCPQLADMDETVEETYEKTVDDINTNAGNVHREMKCVIIQRPSPLLQRKLYLENGQVSDTPTPPSTPNSRRSLISSRDSLLSSPDKTFNSPFQSPRLLLRKQFANNTLSINSSIDSLTDRNNVDHAKMVPLSSDNLHKFDEIKSKDAPIKPKATLFDVMQPPGGPLNSTAEVSGTLNKCENWLQTLNIGQSDRIKSRSHIQLPPI